MDQLMWWSHTWSCNKSMSRSTLYIFNTLHVLSKEPIREQEIKLDCMKYNQPLAIGKLGSQKLIWFMFQNLGKKMNSIIHIHVSNQHFLWYCCIPVPIKTPPNIFRLTTPPKTASTAQWEEASFLSDSAIDSWADREPMSPLEPLDVDMNTFFTSEYIEVLEPVEWGKNKGLFHKLSAFLLI